MRVGHVMQTPATHAALEEMSFINEWGGGRGPTGIWTSDKVSTANYSRVHTTLAQSQFEFHKPLIFI